MGLYQVSICIHKFVFRLALNSILISFYSVNMIKYIAWNTKLTCSFWDKFGKDVLSFFCFARFNLSIFFKDFYIYGYEVYICSLKCLHQVSESRLYWLLFYMLCCFYYSSQYLNIWWDKNLHFSVFILPKQYYSGLILASSME